MVKANLPDQRARSPLSPFGTEAAVRQAPLCKLMPIFCNLIFMVLWVVTGISPNLLSVVRTCDKNLLRRISLVSASAPPRIISP
jgi:hypothetical protein